MRWIDAAASGNFEQIPRSTKSPMIEQGTARSTLRVAGI